MKLLLSVSALLLATACSAQQIQALDLNGVPIRPGQSAGAGCPLVLQSATVAPRGGYLPVDQWSQGDGSLHLQFRNNSGKEVRSAAVTAQLRIKTDKYALDASRVTLRLTFDGITDIDKAVEQIRQITLPKNVYLYGVAQVSLAQVTFADGTQWTAPSPSACQVGEPGAMRIAK